MKSKIICTSVLAIVLSSLVGFGQAISQGVGTERSSVPGGAGVAEKWTVTGGGIGGIVKDPSGALVVGAKVEVKNIESGLTQSMSTDRQGLYVFGKLPAGHYQVSVTSAGFQTSIRGGVVVLDGRQTEVDLGLRIGVQSTVIEINAAMPTVGTEALAPARARASDTASLLETVPGLSLETNGGVSSLPVIHGLADENVKVLVNGMTMAAHCSNHMNPPMSYIDPANVGSIDVMAGITPVSNGGDSIGGSIIVDSTAPGFAAPGQHTVVHGGVSGYHRTNGVISGGNATLSAATEHFSASYTGSYVNAADYWDGAGKLVLSSVFESRNGSLKLAARRGNNLVSVDLGYQVIPEQGFVNDSMDMTKNDGRFVNARYQGAFAWGRLDARYYYSNVGHEMNLLKDKMPGMIMPMDTHGADLGYAVKAEIPMSARDILRVGTELHRNTLDDWWPAVQNTVSAMGPNTFWNVRNGRRYRFGTYLEWETRRGQKWTGIFGVRNDEVLMNTDNVVGYNMSPTATGSAAYFADASAFNANNHSRRDNNFDVTAQGRYEANSHATFESGYARKTRSPSLYERYLWVKMSAMSVEMNGWSGDGNGYVGYLNLRPAVANTISGSADWHDSAKQRFDLKITPYYTYVRNYIDANRCPIISNSNGCSASRINATSGYVTLQFANRDAQLFGVDGSGRLP